MPERVFLLLVAVLGVPLVLAGYLLLSEAVLRTLNRRLAARVRPWLWLAPALLLLAVFLLHAGGFFLGYLFARVLGYDRIIARTISIEVGMQNSGLGAVLARRHFADPLTALPCAISATFHSVIGSILAGIWRLWPAAVIDSYQAPVAEEPGHRP